MDKCIIVGDLGKVLKTLTVGGEIIKCIFTVSVCRTFIPRSLTDYDTICVIARDKLAQYVAKSYRQGGSVEVSGVVIATPYKDESGEIQAKFAIAADDVTILWADKGDGVVDHLDILTRYLDAMFGTPEDEQ